jgi:putative zinc finger/helix-turn-helix YgiT family protein
MDKEKMKCPKCHRDMEIVRKQMKSTFRGVEISYPVEIFKCPVCSLEAGTLGQTASVQKAIADAYRRDMGLLTSREIVDGRTKLGLAQQGLADKMKVGIASIKRWEGATIQTKSMDTMLRHALAGETCGDVCTGNRQFSIPRIKLSLHQLEQEVQRKVLKKGDKMLFAAKYAWYIDMLSFREMGRSITGATYAALPHGPQINNYKELLGDIMGADEKEAEALNDAERRIIRRVAMAFPTDQQVIDAAHKELIWKEKPTGAMIPYTDVNRLTEI